MEDGGQLAGPPVDYLAFTVDSSDFDKLGDILSDRLVQMEIASHDNAASWSMKRFILQQNIARFQTILRDEGSAGSMRWEQEMLDAARRDLALLESAMFGAPATPDRFATTYTHPIRCHSDARLFQHLFERSAHPFLLLDPRPGLHIVDINDAYGHATMTRRGAVVGEKMFDVFPDNPDVPEADGVSNLYDSLRAAAEDRKPHAMAIQRYDIRDDDGCFVERYWRPLNTPIFDEDGSLVYLLHQVDDVTEEVTARRG